MIRNLLVLALLTLVLAPLISLHQLGAVEVRGSARISKIAPMGAASFDSLLAATRL